MEDNIVISKAKWEALLARIESLEMRMDGVETVIVEKFSSPENYDDIIKIPDVPDIDDCQYTDIPDTENDVEYSDDETDDEDSIFSRAFKNHLKILFDALPDLHCLPVSIAYKSENEPYEPHIINVDNNPDWYIRVCKTLGDAIGTPAAKKWQTKFERFVEDEVECYEMSDAEDLYPGQTCTISINRNFEYQYTK